MATTHSMRPPPLSLSASSIAQHSLLSSLSTFPAPPSHIPSSPLASSRNGRPQDHQAASSSNVNPPPTSCPRDPLPPLPGANRSSRSTSTSSGSSSSIIPPRNARTSVSTISTTSSHSSPSHHPLTLSQSRHSPTAVSHLRRAPSVSACGSSGSSSSSARNSVASTANSVTSMSPSSFSTRTPSLKSSRRRGSVSSTGGVSVSGVSTISRMSAAESLRNRLSDFATGNGPNLMLTRSISNTSVSSMGVLTQPKARGSRALARSDTLASEADAKLAYGEDDVELLLDAVHHDLRSTSPGFAQMEIQMHRALSPSPLPPPPPVLSLSIPNGRGTSSNQEKKNDRSAAVTPTPTLTSSSSTLASAMSSMVVTPVTDSDREALPSDNKKVMLVKEKPLPLVPPLDQVTGRKEDGSLSSAFTVNVHQPSPRRMATFESLRGGQVSDGQDSDSDLDPSLSSNGARLAKARLSEDFPMPPPLHLPRTPMKTTSRSFSSDSTGPHRARSSVRKNPRGSVIDREGASSPDVDILIQRSTPRAESRSRTSASRSGSRARVVSTSSMSLRSAANTSVSNDPLPSLSRQDSRTSQFSRVSSAVSASDSARSSLAAAGLDAHYMSEYARRRKKSLGMGLGMADSDFYAGVIESGFGEEDMEMPGRQDGVNEEKGVNEEMEEMIEDDDDDGGSDSELDLHTPLPQIMLREGVLSPHSKVLAQASLGVSDGGRPSSVASHLSTTSSMSVMTKSGLFKDERDTERRRVRHRDGKLLKGGLGLTTGLGWSDSEDEDAPSPFTNRLQRVVSSSSLKSAKSGSSSFSLGGAARSMSMHSSKSTPSRLQNAQAKSNPSLSKSTSAVSFASSQPRSRPSSPSRSSGGSIPPPSAFKLPKTPKTPKSAPSSSAGGMSSSSSSPVVSSTGRQQSLPKRSVLNYSYPLTPDMERNRDSSGSSASGDAASERVSSTISSSSTRIASYSSSTSATCVRTPLPVPSSKIGLRTPRSVSSGSHGALSSRSVGFGRVKREEAVRGLAPMAKPTVTSSRVGLGMGLEAQRKTPTSIARATNQGSRR